MTLQSVLMLLLSTALSIVVALWFGERKSKVEQLQKMQDAIAELQRQQGIQDTKLSPFWASVQSKIAEDLHHPDPRYAEMDKLLEQLEGNPMTITDAGRVRMKELLKERAIDMHPDITDAQRLSAKAMIPIMEKVLEEKAAEPDKPAEK